MISSYEIPAGARLEKYVLMLPPNVRFATSRKLNLLASVLLLTHEPLPCDWPAQRQTAIRPLRLGLTRQG